MAKYILPQGVKLADDGGWRLRWSGNGVVVTDGPYTGAKDVIGGRLIISLAPHRSRRIARAASLARSSPSKRWLEEQHAALLDSST